MNDQIITQCPKDSSLIAKDKSYGLPRRETRPYKLRYGFAEYPGGRRDPNQEERVAKNMGKGLTADEASVLAAVEQLGREPSPRRIYEKTGWAAAYLANKETPTLREVEQRLLNAVNSLLKGGYLLNGRRGSVTLKANFIQSATVLASVRGARGWH